MARAAATIIAIALAAGGALATFKAVYPSLNSDTLYPFAFARDLIEGGNVRDWRITPAPSYIDLAVFAGIALATDGRVVVTYAVYAAIVATFLLTMAIMAQAGATDARAAPWRRAWLGALGVAAVFACERGRTHLRGPLVYPTVHAVPLLLALGTLILLVGSRRGVSRRTIVTAAGIGIVGGGDALFLVQVVAPLVLIGAASLLGGAVERRFSRIAWLIAGVQGAGYVAARMLFGIFGPVVPSPPPPRVDLASIASSAAHFGAYLKDMLPAEVNPAGCVYFAGWWLITCGGLVVSLKRRRRLGFREACTVFVVLSAAGTSLAAVACGTWADGPVVRYVLPTFMLPFPTAVDWSALRPLQIRARGAARRHGHVPRFAATRRDAVVSA